MAEKCTMRWEGQIFANFMWTTSMNDTLGNEHISQ